MAWAPDLLKHYLKNKTTVRSYPSGSRNDQIVRGWFDRWYQKADTKRGHPYGALTNPSKVYDLLTTAPNSEAIPWNQHNPELLRLKKDPLLCGTVVKVVFLKYMKWVPKRRKNLADPDSVAAACEEIKNSLKAKVPVRIGVAYRKGGNASHYVGAVGFKAGYGSRPDEFLCIEPFDGYGGATYAGVTSKYLTILEHKNGVLKYRTREIYAVTIWGY